MDIPNLTRFHIAVNALKKTKRYSAAFRDIGDSSADHSWQLALLVIDSAERLNLDIDIMRAVKIALIHDVCEFDMECDFDASEVSSGKASKVDKDRLEFEAMRFLRDSFNRDDVFTVWREYVCQQTPEARFVKGLDKIESLLHLCATGGCAEEPLDVVRQISYAAEAVSNFSQLRPLFISVATELMSLYDRQGIDTSLAQELIV